MHLCSRQRSSEISSPRSLALTFFWAHLLQVTFDLTKVLDLSLQGFNLKRDAHTKKKKKHRMNDRQKWLLQSQKEGGMWKYFMLNVEFVILPGLERLVEASVTLHRVIHKNGAPSKQKRND